MAEKFLNLSGLTTLWAKLKSTFAKVVHKHAASDITSGTFDTSRIANGAITPEKINVIQLLYQRAEKGGRNWHRIFKVILPTDRTTAESRHSKACRVFDLYIDGYHNKGKYSYVGRLGLNFSIATGMTIADYNFLTHGHARAKWVLGRPSESAYDCKIVKTESTIEFFILSNNWDTGLAVICEKKYDGRFGDGKYDSTIVRNAYTIEEFDTYCSDKVVVDSELDDMKIGSAASADSATKATQDGNGNNIVDTYATKSELDEKADASHKHTASDITSGTLPIARGGTGATTARAAEYNLMSSLRLESNLASEFTDNSKIPCIFSKEFINTTNGVFAGYRKASQIWTYIQSKISSILGLTKDSYGGKAASATSADSATKATQDGNGNNIVDTYATKDGLNSANQRIAGLTTGVNYKLEKDGSNASSTTTYNVLNAALGGGSVEITDDEEIITTYPADEKTYKRTIGVVCNWILDKVKTLIHNRKIQESAITFHKQTNDFIPFGIEIPSSGLYGDFIDANIIVTSSDAAELRGYSFKLTIIPQIWGNGTFRTSGNDTNYKTSMKVLGTANMQDLIGYKLVTFQYNGLNYLGLRVNPKYCIPTSVSTSIIYNLKTEIETSSNLTIKFFERTDISNFVLNENIDFPNSSSTNVSSATIETIQTNNLYDSGNSYKNTYSLNPWVKYNGPALRSDAMDITINIDTSHLITGMCYSLKPHRRGGKWNDDYSITLAFVNSSSETCTIYGGCKNGIGIVPDGTTIGEDENKTTLFTLMAKNDPDIELYVRTSSSGAKNIYIFGY